MSGGQGYNEPVSEAEGMKGYLADAGIDPERILAEDASTNTTQNLIYSGELLNKSEDSVVVVTNNFHMFRALAIAKKQGYLHVEGLSAGTYPLTVPNNLLREAFGIVKDFLWRTTYIIRLQVPAAKCRHRSGHTDKRDEEERYGY